MRNYTRDFNRITIVLSRQRMNQISIIELIQEDEVYLNICIFLNKYATYIKTGEDSVTSPRYASS